MGRNNSVHLKDIRHKIKTESQCRSKYIRDKKLYIGKKYNNLYLKDIVCTYDGYVYGVCNCKCGGADVVTAIKKLLNYETYTCGCSRKSGNIGNSKYDSEQYIGKVYDKLKVVGYHIGELHNEKGVIWELECLNCGKHIEMKATHVVHGTTTSCGCISRERNNKYSSKYLEGTNVNGTKIISILPKEYTGQYWLCKCKYCGKVFKVLARKICSGHINSCGCLAESIGVTEIKKYLNNNKIRYIQEWKTQELLSQYGYMLRFDFAIIGSQEKVIAFIEYDGLHHYLPRGKGYGEELAVAYANLENMQDSDNRKNEYCRINNIPLLRILYSRKINIIIDELDSFINKLNICKGETIC